MFRFFLFALLLLTAALPAAPQAKRAALVIGMSDYQHLSSLINPVPDAKAINAELKSHGFEVSEYITISIAPISRMRGRNSSARRPAPKLRWSNVLLAVAELRWFLKLP